MRTLEYNPFMDSDMLRIHRMIKHKSTGTPKQLAEKLGCSERTVFNKLSFLKQSGLPVFYSKELQSYYYPLPVSMSFMVAIDGEELMKITGGKRGYRNKNKINKSPKFSIV